MVGLFKDEMNGDIITKFVSLRPKLYSYRKLGGEKKCKGIKKGVISKSLSFDDYKTCLFDRVNLYRSQLMFRSIKHNVHMIEVNKLALSANDDKRIIEEGGISTKGRGHYLS